MPDTLRSSLIRLAAVRDDLRPHLMRLLTAREALRARPPARAKPRSYKDYAEEASSEGRTPLTEKEWQSRQRGSGAWGVREGATILDSMNGRALVDEWRKVSKGDLGNLVEVLGYDSVRDYLLGEEVALDDFAGWAVGDAGAREFLIEWIANHADDQKWSQNLIDAIQDHKDYPSDHGDWEDKVRRLIGDDFEVYEGYSGRGMFGEKSEFAFTTPIRPDSPEGEKLRRLGLSYDSMGRRYVYYTR
jgi:hypothetical protein